MKVERRLFARNRGAPKARLCGTPIAEGLEEKESSHGDSPDPTRINRQSHSSVLGDEQRSSLCSRRNQLGACDDADVLALDWALAGGRRSRRARRNALENR